MKPILIIDDDRDIRESMRDTLSDEGFPTAEAADGGEALVYLREHDVSLILLDWNMAPIDGPTFMAEVAKDERLKAFPVVLVTADSRITARGPLDGFVATLRKPIDLEKLFALCERYCPHAAS